MDFTDSTSTLEGECRAYTPVLDRFRSVTAGACRFTADESLGMGTTVVEETGVVTATGAALPAAPGMASANPVGHYARTETFVMANVGDAIAVSSTGGTVPAIPEVSVTRPTTLTFDARPANAVSRAAGWTVAHQAAGAGELRVVISQNMGNVYKQAVCLADATATSLVVPPEITGEFFIGTAFAAFERVDQTLTTAGDYAVTVDTPAPVELAAGGALTGMSITFAD